MVSPTALGGLGRMLNAVYKPKLNIKLEDLNFLNPKLPENQWSYLNMNGKVFQIAFHII